MSGVHPVANAFGLQTDAYEKARPSYPVTIIQNLITSLNLKKGDKVLDFGAGTGKLTRLIASYGFELSAADQSANMLEKFKQVLPDVPAFVASAESIPSPDNTYDAIFIAQAFHWFANEKALAELNRVLKKDGVLVLIWNLENRDGAPWVADLRDIYERYENNTPQYRLGLWKKVWQTDLASTLFHPDAVLPHAQDSYTMASTAAMVWGRVLSKSYISDLASKDPQEFDKMKKDVFEVIRRIPGFEGIGEIDEISETEKWVEYPYKTDAYCYRKN
eukprot:TRINITY_DN1177_c0_g1_i1.p1 TRINITY_DN1177_c0_g1~~TRINITY_DN1177_c0_g1_i1.p1  ORF type:complete len:275 (-),score=102.97 TRINITY_DN1177_c0_g1_i1:128-952(-)